MLQPKLGSPLKKVRPRLFAERLEDRCTPTTVKLVSGVIQIEGDSWRNDAHVYYQNGKVQVRVESTPQTGFAITPDVVHKSYTPSSVKSISFDGNSGDDRYVSDVSDIPSLGLGGSGNDYLEGSKADDEFRGGEGNDTLRGFGGDDCLYGDSDNDILRGGDGNDGLYGGNGRDELYGNGGKDRFLQFVGEKEQKDAVTHDALLYFKNSSATWSHKEIRWVDSGLKYLHKRTGNDNLLELKSGKSITFVRRISDGGDTSVYADNDSAGTINVYNKAFNNQDICAQTIIHEMGHNWDSEHSKWSSWKSIINWKSTNPRSSSYVKSTDGEWWYLKNKASTFALSYGKSSPYEDWCVAWESYFVFRYSLNNVQNLKKLSSISSAKFDHLVSFFNAQSVGT